jgi:methanogenic corrinoid protein MtbC1
VTKRLTRRRRVGALAEAERALAASLVQQVVAITALHEAMQAGMSEVGDEGRLADVELPNLLQKQQQTLQMLASLSRDLHETTGAVVRKVGG